MIYEIRHRVEYRYSLPVYLEPHQLHLTPRSDSFQTLKQFHLRVEPEPAGLTSLTDAFGNPAHEIWFSGNSDKLILETSGKVETLCQNPFDFLLHERSLRLPVRYSPSLNAGLVPFLGDGKIHPRVAEFAAAIGARTGYETMGFLSELCAEIKRTIHYGRREEGFPFLPFETLEKGEGACRDLAMLFMVCCRFYGLAARFTSGYAFEKSSVIEKDLHAWAEVYMEGAGWRGFDPSTGLLVSDAHVALASAPSPESVSPVFGSFRSSQAVAQLQTEVRISPFAEAHSA